jgi:hypothetical protein
MGFNWKNILSSEEKIEKEFTVSKMYLISLAIISIGGGIFLFFYADLFTALFVSFLGVIYCFYLNMTKHFAFTDKRIIVADSFPGLNIISVDYDQITDISVEQNLIEQMMFLGTIIVNTAGTHSPEIKMNFVDSPEQLKRKLDEYKEKRKQKI